MERTAEAVAAEARRGLTASPKTLSPWLFYDAEGSRLFEQITELPEYYLTRTERAIFAEHAQDILEEAARGKPVAIVELGAGTATKTGLLLEAAVRRQQRVLYQPVDVSETALEEARANIEERFPGVMVRPQVADYTVEALDLTRPAGSRTLALYIGSSIGNFSEQGAGAVLRSLRQQLHPGGALLLGTDLAPGPHKTVETLLAAYDDRAGVTAAFNRNVLVRLNREVGTDFEVETFRHRVRWNAARSRIEMHLEATRGCVVRILGGETIRFAAGETIHTENSYKFSVEGVGQQLRRAGFSVTRTFRDREGLFAVTLASTGQVGEEDEASPSA